MTAKDVPVNYWFMTKEKKWYRKEEQNKTHAVCSVIGSNKQYLINNDEEVQVRT